MGDELDQQLSVGEKFRDAVGESGMQVMDVVDDDFAKMMLTFHEHVALLVRELRERGIEAEHAAQLICSFAVGAALSGYRD